HSLCICFFFFFSSRRRHTRSKRDWSSDVCSSDLAWLTYVRDDCVENDHVQPGLIDDSLFDGCYVGISERPSTAIIASGYDGRNDLLTVRQSLIRLQPMPGPRGGLPTDFGNGQFFKWSDLA